MSVPNYCFADAGCQVAEDNTMALIREGITMSSAGLIQVNDDDDDCCD